MRSVKLRLWHCNTDNLTKFVCIRCCGCVSGVSGVCVWVYIGICAILHARLISTWPNLLCRLQTQDSMILLRIEYRRQSTGHAISIARCSLTVFTAQSQLSERYCMPRFEDIFITLSRCARALWCDASISITAQYRRCVSWQTAHIRW